MHLGYITALWPSTGPFNARLFQRCPSRMGETLRNNLFQSKPLLLSLRSVTSNFDNKQKNCTFDRTDNLLTKQWPDEESYILLTKSNMGGKKSSVYFFASESSFFSALRLRQWLANKSLRDGLFHLGKVENSATKLKAVSAFCG